MDHRKFISWGEWLEARQSRCEHAFSASCMHCAPPRAVSYRMKPGCGRHPAWPRGICLDCAPPAVELAPQPYRHVDFIQVSNFEEMGGFVALWSGNARAGVQRAGLLYGTYAPDANFRKGVKAVVQAIYEPPQSWDAVNATVALLPETAESVRVREAGERGGGERGKAAGASEQGRARRAPT